MCVSMADIQSATAMISRGKLVSCSLTSLFNTNMAISETIRDERSWIERRGKKIEEEETTGQKSASATQGGHNKDNN